MWNRIIKRCKQELESLSIYLLILTVIYIIIANTVFAFRHPWATDMERFIHIGDALVFKKISYKEMRGGYDKE
jgi:hypothetical protein